MEEPLTEQHMVDYVKNTDLSDLIRDGEPAELAPPDRREVMAVRTVRLVPAVYDKLLQIATDRGVGTSVLMREIIEQWVADQTGPGVKEAVVPVAALVEFLHRTARPAA